MGGGGYKTAGGTGGQLKYYPSKKCVCVWGGGGLSHATGGGGTNSLGVVLTQELVVLDH